MTGFFSFAQFVSNLEARWDTCYLRKFFPVNPGAEMLVVFVQTA